MFNRILNSFFIFLLFFSLLSFVPQKQVFSAFSSNPEVEMLSTNGTVNAIAYDDNYVYLGGNFTKVGHSLGFGTSIAIADGEPNFNFPFINNVIYVAIPDGSNGWYIGGNFTLLDGTTRNRLAHVFEDGTINPNFNPNIINGSVLSLALSPDGTILYAGGSFTTVNGSVARNRLAAFNTSNGNVVTAFDPNVDNTIRAIEVSPDGSIIYIGGEFTTVNGATSRSRIAAFTTADGVVTAFDPHPSSIIYDLELNSDGSILYTGGFFASVNNGSVARNNIAAFTTADGVATAFNPNLNGAARSIELSSDGSILYAGGIFTSTAGNTITRNRLASFNTSDSSTTSFNPNINNAIYEMFLSHDGSSIFIGGDFTTVNGSTARARIAEIEIASSTATAFKSNVDSSVYALKKSNDGTRFYAGGLVTRFHSVDVTNLTRIAHNGDIYVDENFKPSFNDEVRALAFNSDKSILYVGGSFSSVNSVNHNRLVGLNMNDFSVNSSFAPNVAGAVRTIAVSSDDSIVYAGGNFTTVNGSITRNRLAGFTTADGIVTAFDPNISFNVHKIQLSSDDSLIYAGGEFTTVNGSITRNRLAGFTTADGIVTAFDPNMNGIVYDFDLNSAESLIYVAGAFTTVNSNVTRHRSASFNTSTGAVDSFYVSLNNTSRAVKVSSDDSSIFFAGDFSSIGGFGSVGRFASLGASNSAVSAFLPSFNASVNTINFSSKALYVGGAFTTVNSDSSFQYFTAFDDADGPETTITDNPDSVSLVSSAEFSFIGTDNLTPASGLTFECKLNDESYSSCTSPKNYTSLLNGEYTFYVRATDGSGNVDATPATYNWTVAVPPPEIVSITRNEASLNNLDQVSWTVVFNEGVTGVDASDFVLFEDGISGSSIDNISGSGDTYTVTVETGTGYGTLRLDLTDDDTIVNIDQVPLDLAQNFEGEEYTIDKQGPLDGSISYVDGYRNLLNVSLTVDDGTDAGSGVDVDSRIVERRMASITNHICGSFGSFSPISISGTYPDFVDTNVLDGRCYQYRYKVSDLSQNETIYTNNNVVKIDVTPPEISINQPSEQAVQGGLVYYELTYSGADSISLTAGDVVLNTTGTAEGEVAIIGTGPTLRTVAIYNIAGDGEISITILGGSASDLAGNEALETGPSDSFVVDNTDPLVEISTPSETHTMGGPVTYTITFTGADAITLDNDDITLNNTGTATGDVNVTGSGLDERTVTISNITGDGTLSISIDAGVASDLAGNTSQAVGPSESFVVDNIAPVLEISEPSTTHAMGGPVSYTLTYTGADSISLALGDITLNKTGTADGDLSISGTGNTERTVTISNITGNGTLGLTIASDTASDLAGNLANDIGPSNTFIVDNIAPTIDISAPSLSETNSNPVTYTLTFTDTDFITLSNNDITLNKTGTADGDVNVTGSGLEERTVTISNITGDGTLSISIASNTASDLAGNTSQAVGPSESFVVDNTLPVVTISSPSLPQTQTGPVTYIITFTGATNVNITNENITLNTTGSATGTIDITGSGLEERTVTISDTFGEGLLSISVDAGVARDDVSNLSLIAGPSETFIVDTIAPVITEAILINNTTLKKPNYVFHSTEIGEITYGGSCVSLTINAVAGNNNIIFEELALGAYSDCTILVTDSLGNESNILEITPFNIISPASNSRSGSFLSPTVLKNLNISIDPKYSPWTPNNNLGISLNIPSGSTSSSSFNFTRTLRALMTGEDVRELQKLLNAKGFIVSETGPGSIGNETTMFGAKTRTALIRFQRANPPLSPDGVFGPMSRAVLTK